MRGVSRRCPRWPPGMVYADPGWRAVSRPMTLPVDDRCRWMALPWPLPCVCRSPTWREEAPSPVGLPAVAPPACSDIEDYQARRGGMAGRSPPSRKLCWAEPGAAGACAQGKKSLRSGWHRWSQMDLAPFSASDPGDADDVLSTGRHAMQCRVKKNSPIFAAAGRPPRVH